MFWILTLLNLSNASNVDVGLASVFNDKVLACPRTSYKHSNGNICAHRSLPCGEEVNIVRIDNGKISSCTIADRGPFGFCVQSKRNTRECGMGARWINGSKFIKHKTPIKSGTWRGILDMSPKVAKRLGIKNRLVRVMIYTKYTNTPPLYDSICQDEDDPKFCRTIEGYNEINSRPSRKIDSQMESDPPAGP